MIGDQEIRKSLKTKDWERAQKQVREWEAEQKIEQDDSVGPVTVEEVCEAYMADATARNLEDETLRKCRTFFRQLQLFADEKGIRYMHEIDFNDVTSFRATWRDHGLSANKKLERFRPFFRIALDHEWVKENYAKKLWPPQVSQRPTVPSTEDLIKAVLAACVIWDQKCQGKGQARENSCRMRALVLLLRYSGLRIEDAVTLGRDRIEDGKLFLYTAKTGTHVYLPLPDFVIDALNEAPISSEYFFGLEYRSRKTRQRPGKISFTAFSKMQVLQEDTLIDFGTPWRSICCWLAFRLKGFGFQ